MKPVSSSVPEAPGSPADSAVSQVPDLDAEYRQAREECALHQPDDRSWIEVSGAEAAEFLQGQVTNDVESLAPGSGCYALLLDRKAHIQAEMRLLRLSDERFLIETGSDQSADLLKHLGMYKIGRTVEVAAADLVTLALLGPATAEVSGVAPGPEHSSSSTRIAGADCLAVSTDLGLDLICSQQDRAAVLDELDRRHAVPVSAQTAEILRVESGRPRYGLDMTAASMPAEAGLEERAISFEKGCYIGQEPVARLHYRGKPNRHLRGLKLTTPAVTGDLVKLGDRELGTIGTVVLSPARGRLALAVLRREAEPGATVTVIGENGESQADVTELPFVEAGA